MNSKVKFAETKLITTSSSRNVLLVGSIIVLTAIQTVVLSVDNVKNKEDFERFANNSVAKVIIKQMITTRIPNSGNAGIVNIFFN